MEKGYEKLEIFKLSRDLAIEIHKMTLSLPRFEIYEEGSQIRRSAKSVPANIVEGYALRRHKAEYLQYLHRALGSCDETLVHLGILLKRVARSLTTKCIRIFPNNTTYSEKCSFILLSL